MNLQNPLQIAAILKIRPGDVNAVIRIAGIQSHKVGLRAGLYDLDQVKAAVERTKQPKTEG
jgi:hypothetical protein